MPAEEGTSVVLKSLRIGLLAGAVSVAALPALGVELVYFYDPGCPHCARMDLFLQEIAPDYPELEVIRFNIREPESRAILEKLLAAYGVELGPVPLIFVGDVALIGDTFYGLEDEPVTLHGRASSPWRRQSSGRSPRTPRRPWRGRRGSRGATWRNGSPCPPSSWPPRWIRSTLVVSPSSSSSSGRCLWRAAVVGSSPSASPSSRRSTSHISSWGWGCTPRSRPRGSSTTSS